MGWISMISYLRSSGHCIFGPDGHSDHTKRSRSLSPKTFPAGSKTIIKIAFANGLFPRSASNYTRASTMTVVPSTHYNCGLFKSDSSYSTEGLFTLWRFYKYRLYVHTMMLAVLARHSQGPPSPVSAIPRGLPLGLYLRGKVGGLNPPV